MPAPCAYGSGRYGRGGERQQTGGTGCRRPPSTERGGGCGRWRLGGLAQQPAGADATAQRDNPRTATRGGGALGCRGRA